ncbi:MAG: class II glutamine amidotransferase [Gammaproteobacteria bacterium]|nr:MAG: class II glutamine amidotransferase [Gammaproteobacteria bacterium]
MCELFGISSNRPVELAESLVRFGKRGGEAADNPDGWGLAWLDDGHFSLRKEPVAAATSPVFTGLSETLCSDLVLAHVRKANPPTDQTLANTHPFTRECCCRQWIFAHNGKVPELVQPDGCCRPQSRVPLGETDSEHAFCFLLDEIAKIFSSDKKPSHDSWVGTLATLSSMIASYGQFNFLMSEGEYLVAYGHDRLHALERCCQDTRLILIASEPLTVDEPWLPFTPGELQIFRAGERVARIQTAPPHPDGPGIAAGAVSQVNERP